MIYYHATSHRIKRPNPIDCAKHSGAQILGEPIIGLFCNASDGLSEYGDNLYRFSLSETARILEISDHIYQFVRLSRDYRAGIFDTARLLGYVAIRRRHSAEDISAVVLDFNAIEGWKLCK